MNGNVERLERVKAAMTAQGLDALICRLPENVLFLSGYWPMVGMTFLIFPLDGEPVSVLPLCDEREAEADIWHGEIVTFPFGILTATDPYAAVAGALRARHAEGQWRRVGFEGSFETIAPAWNAAEHAILAGVTIQVLRETLPGAELVDATDFLHTLRATKTPWEVEKFRRTNEIATFGLAAFYDGVTVGASGVELVAAVESAILTQGTGYHGARRVRAFAQVSTGAAETAEGFRPMVISTSRKLETGELALLELGVVADGYWCDRTRVRVAGAATPRQRAVYEAVIAAQDAALAAVRAGVTAGHIDAAARQVIRAAGFEEGFCHVTGHGVGFRYHEPVPCLAPGDPLVLEPGMLHSVEPGVYLPDLGGIRVEDNVVVTESGADLLAPYRREME